jgi:hypothetical protein
MTKRTKYGPKGPLSPSLGDPCLVCGHPLATGDFTTLVPRQFGGRYVDDGAEVHWRCAASASSKP